MGNLETILKVAALIRMYRAVHRFLTDYSASRLIMRRRSATVFRYL